MLTVFTKELRSFLSSLIAYIVIVVFLTGIGLFMWVFPSTNVLDYGYADLESLFTLAPYVFMFLIPAITMRTFAEEKKTGTMELLFTRPLTDWDIILGKYLSSLVLVILALVPTLVYYFSIYQLGIQPGNIDTPGTMGSYVGLILLGAVFTAIGLLASVLTESQIVSFIVALFLCFIFFEGFGYLANIRDSSDFSYYIVQFGISHHYETIRRGLIDSRNLMYFFSVIAMMLLTTKLILGSRKW
ncbi:MAG TPA: gliding motility-associated ABC transporter permease subunit GldF [Microscillaceae bacterium]|nr:gliding motility-associated ABC transporter permease subunit GldF [Microscillaceae bacterium]